ncbi:hypothetical protein O3P69_020642 [Scylla paramamosain]|uniref:Uncharacterized protein n=1 Tax=Scylla paramamosain TaxID=85552 RepID=A0AAW0TNF5_SCYPA
MLLRSPQNSETSNDQRKRKHRSPTPLGQDLVTKLGVESADEQSKQGAEGKKEEAADKLADIKKDSLPGNEDNEKKEVSKKEKEKRKKPRKEKRKDGSRPGSRCAVLQEAQFRREVEHEEGRGRRLAQEIKGFNWLEQKIKNSSLLSSRTVPSTPTSSSSGKELESPSKSVSSTPTTSSSHFTFGNKEEEHARKNSFSGSSSSIGFKRHLQTAVPPLIPSSKVTALPKRRPSLGTPITPPCSAPPTLCSATSVPSMIVQGALYTCEPTPYRSGHGRVPPPLEKSSTSLEHAEADKATLYSSTSSTKATLYGVKDNSLEALYDTVSVNAVNYYDSVTSGNIDTQYNITTSPPICFYGSAKYQEPGLHPDKTPATAPHAKSSVISTSQDSGGMTDHQVDKLHSPKPDTCSSRNSDWSAWQGSSPNSQHSGYSADPHSPQRFSHKQALLRRAFQEMMKKDIQGQVQECQVQEYQGLVQGYQDLVLLLQEQVLEYQNLIVEASLEFTKKVAPKMLSHLVMEQCLSTALQVMRILRGLLGSYALDARKLGTAQNNASVNIGASIVLPVFYDFSFVYLRDDGGECHEIDLCLPLPLPPHSLPWAYISLNTCLLSIKTTGPTYTGIELLT